MNHMCICYLSYIRCLQGSCEFAVVDASPDSSYSAGTLAAGMTSQGAVSRGSAALVGGKGSEQSSILSARTINRTAQQSL